MTPLPKLPIPYPDLSAHLLDTSQTGIFVCQPVTDTTGHLVDFNLSYANPVAGTLFGQAWSQRFTKTKSCGQLFSEVEGPFLFGILLAVFHTGVPYRNVDFLYVVDGEPHWYYVSITQTKGAVVTTARDVTQQVQLQRDQQRQAQLLNGILKTSPNGIIVYEFICGPVSDPARGQASGVGEILDLQPVFFNEAYLKLVGESAERIKEQTLSQRLGQETYTELSSLIRSLIDAGKCVQLERFFPHLGKWLSISGSRTENGIMFVIDDVSARKEAESVQQYQSQELQALNEELTRSNENLLEFSYVASHDLQEPLRKIQQFGTVLEEHYGPVLGSSGNDLVHRMQQASIRMSVLIRDLLDYSRLSKQPRAYHQQDLNELVTSALSALELVVSEKKAVIDVKLLGTIAGDATQLTQAFQNLLTNALKFSRPDQVPHIRISSQSIGFDDLPSGFQPKAGQNQFCAIHVADDGIGFEQTQADRIFGAFQRLHGRGEYPGTGIGLAIVKKVVENHGGYILAESQPDQGATFTIYLPTSGSENES
ncbi:PAS domain-containing sensor histidine kinase [Spirosoma utsteinense]|uniref:histidine kinase n=1 Tax=Spirosoma utsteinense TaxID=2585773 RepID=A0ABR6W8C1_9BACT|nr:ATP-binding protein [Spirosoma utsteinense]MBC3787521.1 signal transduction histidine kinase [Spirosoma utsteinense]MBC3792206.1 signal transduction histidine kinase [Spirosoma utsteinense]